MSTNINQELQKIDNNILLCHQKISKLEKEIITLKQKKQLISFRNYSNLTTKKYKVKIVYKTVKFVNSDYSYYSLYDYIPVFFTSHNSFTITDNDYGLCTIYPKLNTFISNFIINEMVSLLLNESEKLDNNIDDKEFDIVINFIKDYIK